MTNKQLIDSTKPMVPLPKPIVPRTIDNWEMAYGILRSCGATPAEATLETNLGSKSWRAAPDDEELSMQVRVQYLGRWN